MSYYDKGGRLPKYVSAPGAVPVMPNVLYWVVLGADDDESYKLEFESYFAAREYANEHGGDAYPVVDVRVIE